MGEGVLAYVFWHWRRPEVDGAEYARRLVEFHRALSLEPSPGFSRSAAFRSGAAPWIVGEESFEDWYLIGGSAALDPLNEAAVSGPRLEPHQAAARAAAGGCAGLYRLRLGSADVARARWTLWFAKPEGTSYEQLFGRLNPLLGRSATGLWGRQMTLGPTPEFCLAAPEPLAPIQGLQGLTRHLEQVWPAA